MERLRGPCPSSDRLDSPSPPDKIIQPKRFERLTIKEDSIRPGTRILIALADPTRRAILHRLFGGGRPAVDRVWPGLFRHVAERRSRSTSRCSSEPRFVKRRQGGAGNHYLVDQPEAARRGGGHGIEAQGGPPLGPPRFDALDALLKAEDAARPREERMMPMFQAKTPRQSAGDPFVSTPHRSGSSTPWPRPREGGPLAVRDGDGPDWCGAEIGRGGGAAPSTSRNRRERRGRSSTSANTSKIDRPPSSRVHVLASPKIFAGQHARYCRYPPARERGCQLTLTHRRRPCRKLREAAPKPAGGMLLDAPGQDALETPTGRFPSALDRLVACSLPPRKGTPVMTAETYLKLPHDAPVFEGLARRRVFRCLV